MIVISPHLDDAVFSASSMLEGAMVATICAGLPPPDTPPTQFDRLAGFTSGAEAMRARRAEDRRAAEIGGFTTYNLSCLDAGYGHDATLEDGVAFICRYAELHGEQILGPVGIRHPDHLRIAAALPASALRYEELPYAYLWRPDDLADADEVREGASWKERAVRAYASQITPASHIEQILASERYHGTIQK